MARCSKKTDDESDICFDCELEEKELFELEEFEKQLRKTISFAKPLASADASGLKKVKA